MMKFALLAAVSLFTGCASITDGTSQTIVVSVTPREARCIATRDSIELSSFNGKNPMLTVSKGARDILITCKLLGYDDATSRLVSKTQTEGMMSVLFLDLGVTDMITGAMWKYPSNVSILLEPSGSTLETAASVIAKPAVLQPPAVTAATPSAGPVGVAIVKPAPQGQDGYNAERLSESRACNPSPKATLTNKGPGVETYTVMCSSGDSLTVRCEWGNCRALK